MAIELKRKKVRKQFILDLSKLRQVRRITKARTDTEAVNEALDRVIFGEKTARILKKLGGKFDIVDVYQRIGK
jgi:uncharacterized linocin/CFP29 family protein